jgi:hypothetical protein
MIDCVQCLEQYSAVGAIGFVVFVFGLGLGYSLSEKRRPAAVAADARSEGDLCGRTGFAESPEGTSQAWAPALCVWPGWSLTDAQWMGPGGASMTPRVSRHANSVP